MKKNIDFFMIPHPVKQQSLQEDVLICLAAELYYDHITVSSW